MGELQIGTFDATLEIQADATAPPAASMPGDASGASDVQRLRELLPPLVLEVLEDELARYSRIRG